MHTPALKSRLSQLSTVVAALRLEQGDRQHLGAMILRLHRGRWPLMRCLAMREVGGVLYEAVRWRRCRAPSCGVVTWRADGLGLSWQPAPTGKAAIAVLRSLR
jgi:hypothetical protein